MNLRFTLAAAVVLLCILLVIGCEPREEGTSGPAEPPTAADRAAGKTAELSEPDEVDRAAGATSDVSELEAADRAAVIEALIEQLVIADQPAADAPVYTPGPDTPPTDPRVQAYEAARQLEAYGKAAFPHLLKHFDDDRQSVCFRRVLPCDVGLACFAIIEDQIFPLPEDCIRSIDRTGADGTTHDRPFFSHSAPRLFDSRTLESWLRERADQSLTEMQIEAIEWLIAEETKIGFPDRNERKKYLDPLMRQLKRLKAKNR